MRVVGYLRVSTDRQVEEGLGLEIQRQSISSWARSAGHRVSGWCSDEGVSGSNGLELRLGLGRAIDLLRSGEAQAIVVHRLDRLARDLVLQEQLLTDVRRIGAEVFSTSSAEAGILQDDPDDPSRRLIRQVLGAVAEYERSMIGLRLRAGRARKAENGGFAFGAPPFGKRTVDRRLAPDDAEQATVTRIFEMRAAGASLRKIAAVLESEGRVPRRSTHWHPTTIKRVLDRSSIESADPTR
jgi:DNA invertase Pin-like site-specific DNA recombinase